MVPLEPSWRRAYFAGFAVAVGFRWFFVVAIWMFCALADNAQMRGASGTILVCLLWLSALVAVYATPFLAGFLAAFFWRHVRWRAKSHDQINAVGGAALLAWLPILVFATCFAIPILWLDIRFCTHGVNRGITFWNSRQGRQFLGDFEARDDD